MTQACTECGERFEAKAAWQRLCWRCWRHREDARLHDTAYHDGYHEALMKVVEAKLEGKVVEAPEEPAETRVMDLMEALRASVEAAKSKKEAPAAEAKEKPKRARKAS